MKQQIEIPIIRHPIQVMFFDTDLSGMVHNLAFLRYIEIARTILAEQIGMSLAEMAETKLFPVIVRTDVEYKRAATVSDQLIIECKLDQIERARLWFSSRIIRLNDDTLLVTCRQTLALVQLPEGRPARVPAEWLERYDFLNEAKHSAVADVSARGL